MGRSKKSGMNWLAWRLNNPELARSIDENEAGSEQEISLRGQASRIAESVMGAGLEQEITGRVMACRECGTQRVIVPVDEVPAEVRTNLEKSMKIKDFIHCPMCGTYSGLGDWGSF